MTTSGATARTARKLSGRHVLGAMVAFFGVIIIADATMIYQAVSTFGGVDNRNAYRDGLAYNARIAREAQQDALGWTDTVELTPDPARIRVSLKDAAGGTPGALRVEATLGRPATDAADVTLRLGEATSGVFEAPLARAPEAGTWIATVRAFAADGVSEEPVFEVRRRLWIAP